MLKPYNPKLMEAYAVNRTVNGLPRKGSAEPIVVFGVVGAPFFQIRSPPSPRLPRLLTICSGNYGGSILCSENTSGWVRRATLKGLRIG
jgi:hypothetical protein